MSVTAKFTVVSKTKGVGYSPYGTTPVYSYSIEARPVSSGSPENEKYFLATPGGELKLYVLNKLAADQFEPGDEFIIIMDKVEKEPKA